MMATLQSIPQCLIADDGDSTVCTSVSDYRWWQLYGLYLSVFADGGDSSVYTSMSDLQMVTALRSVYQCLIAHGGGPTVYTSVSDCRWWRLYGLYLSV